ncbi:MAG: gamma-glutamyltransferase family protein [Actinomycetota bacterium]|nr:gamma-glutamyltransferase family protein [Actinomycetota bacterium]
MTAVRASRPQGYPEQSRSEVLARNGVAATSQPLMTATAERILLDGGNAVDAAVAAAATAGVVEPMATGLGGDMFALVWSARDKKLYGLESSGWAPKGWTPEYFEETLGVDQVPGSGINSVTVPGAVAGWDAILERFGTMGFRQVLEPARRYAAEGFPVHERVAHDWRTLAPNLRTDADTVDTFLPNGEPPGMYGIFRNPDLARTLRLIQRGGRDAFYEGPIARAIVRKSRAAGGVMQLDDLAQFAQSKGGKLVKPISVDYHGYDIHQLPPPGQGFAALEILNILDVCAPRVGFDLAELGPRDPKYWHFIVEAKKLAYSDLLRYNADPASEDVPLRTLLSKEYAATLCDKLDPERARPADVRGNIPGGTVYLTVGDRWGNMVSFVDSISGFFGSYVTVPGYGFLLNNRGANFTLEEGHPNQVAPRKRPFITITAGFITKDGQPLMAFGNKGGTTQPQAQAQHVVNMVDLGMNVQATADAARFDHDQVSDTLGLDTGQLGLVGPQLTELGHRVVQARGQSGVYQGLLFERDRNLRPARMPPRGTPCCPGALETNRGRSRLFEQPLNGVYRAGSDLRQDGHAGGCVSDRTAALADRG